MPDVAAPAVPAAPALVGPHLPARALSPEMDAPLNIGVLIRKLQNEPAAAVPTAANRADAANLATRVSAALEFCRIMRPDLVDAIVKDVETYKYRIERLATVKAAADQMAPAVLPALEPTEEAAVGGEALDAVSSQTG
ncbi:hypothetical protein JCM3770_004478 [Rhodotorula araucariae]